MVNTRLPASSTFGFAQDGSMPAIRSRTSRSNPDTPCALINSDEARVFRNGEGRCQQG